MCVYMHTHVIVHVCVCARLWVFLLTRMLTFANLRACIALKYMQYLHLSHSNAKVSWSDKVSMVGVLY